MCLLHISHYLSSKLEFSYTPHYIYHYNIIYLSLKIGEEQLAKYKNYIFSKVYTIIRLQRINVPKLSIQNAVLKIKNLNIIYICIHIHKF